MSGREAVMEWPGGPDVLDALKDVATSHRPVSASKVRSTTVWIMRRPLNSLSLGLTMIILGNFFTDISGMQNNCLQHKRI